MLTTPQTSSNVPRVKSERHLIQISILLHWKAQSSCELTERSNRCLGNASVPLKAKKIHKGYYLPSSPSTIPSSEPQKRSGGHLCFQPLPFHLSFPSVHSSQGSANQKSNTRHSSALFPNVRRPSGSRNDLSVDQCRLS